MGGLARRGSNGGNATFKSSDALLEDINRGLIPQRQPKKSGLKGTVSEVYVHDPAVDVSEFFETEEAGAMSAVIENIALELSQLVSASRVIEQHKSIQ